MIRTRPTEEDYIVGKGPYLIRMTMEQLQLISALMYITTLGGSSEYATAAYQLMTTIDEELMLDQDFGMNSFNEINFNVSIHDYDADTKQTYPAEVVSIDV